jgi:excisionase family DNA binding protein
MVRARSTGTPSLKSLESVPGELTAEVRLVANFSSRTGVAEPMIKGRERTTRSPWPWRPVMAENELLTPAEVAVMFRVNPKTVTRWARAGRISAVRTLGGHRRFRAAEIRRFLEEVQDLPA